MQPFDLKMVHCRKALEVFDADKSKRDQMLEKVRHDAGFKRWEAAETIALAKLQEAFYLDTRDRNSRDSCNHVDEHFVRQLVTESVRVFGLTQKERKCN